MKTASAGIGTRIAIARIAGRAGSQEVTLIITGVKVLHRLIALTLMLDKVYMSPKYPRVDRVSSHEVPFSKTAASEQDQPCAVVCQI